MTVFVYTISDIIAVALVVLTLLLIGAAFVADLVMDRISKRRAASKKVPE